MAHSHHPVALITGASSGVGRALAQELAQLGIGLILIGRKLERLEALAQCLPVSVTCYRTDLTIDEDIQAMTQAVSRQVSHLDYLVHSAGVFAMGRLEHAEVIAEEDVDRCKRLGVVVSMQPYHFTDDARWLPRRLDPELCRRVSPWRSLVERDVPVCFGSDAPFTNISALDGIRSAIHRLDTVRPADRSRFADEALTPEQALACYCVGGAFAAFEEDRFGSLQPGRPADVTVLDTGLSRVLLTLRGGRITWKGEGSEALLT
jgi:predicted amidohydrolase YtcJ